MTAKLNSIRRRRFRDRPFVTRPVSSISRSLSAWILTLLISALTALPLNDGMARLTQPKARSGNYDPKTKQGLAPTPGLTEAQVAEGWLSLFDGETLFGWQPVSNANWQVIEGTIRVSEGQPGLLRTTTQFDDYQLELDFQCQPRTNSGVFLRTSPQPKSLTSDCYELNIASRLDHEFPTGSLVDRVVTRTDFVPALDEAGQPAWQHLKAVVNGPLTKVWIDGHLAIEYDDSQSKRSLRRGFIGLQFREGAVAFREIRLKPLNIPVMELNSRLDGWSQSQTLASKFSVTKNGELQITNGSGTLETKQQFADFIFSAQIKTNADGLNSGIFFRCIPDELMNGYESQIQNQFKNDDRTQPVDCGTGGIFRRVNARRVNANDQAWFRKTIVATGPHIAVWVNGYQVTDWTDQRQPDPNPRKGLRLEAGSIMLQGHDPTTDILLKEIAVREQFPRAMPVAIRLVPN